MNGDALGTVLPLLLGLVLLAIVALSAWLALIFARRASGNGADAEVGSSPAVPSPSADDALVRLYRDERGLWIVEVRGQRYADLMEVEDERLRQEVVEGLRFLVAFSKRYVARQRESSVQETPNKPKVKPSASPQGREEQRQRQGVSESVKDKLKLVYGERSAKRPRRPVMRPSRPPALLPQIDLAKEIGDILEEMQAKHPALRDRLIRLQNAPEGGVLFVVDGRLYPAVDAIPDEEVRALIRAATRAWEERVK